MNTSSPAASTNQDAVARFRIPTMDCPTEEGQIRRALEFVTGIRRLSFQLTERTIDITGSPESIEQAVKVIRDQGFDPQPQTEKSDVEEHTGGGEGLPRLSLALVAALASEAVSFFLSSGTLTTATSMTLAAIAIGLSGFSTYKKGWMALRQRRLNMNALMSVAVTGAFAIGQWPEAAMVMALYGIAELIEARAADRARNAIQQLLALAPEHAEVSQADGSWKTTPVADVPIEAVVRIRPGERIPLDGLITQGTSAVNQAPVTGESIPVDKSVGDVVFAGTINENGELHVRVTAGANDSTLARIIHAVEEAQATRAPTQKFVDRFAAVYTPTVFFVAVALALGAPWLFGWTLMESLYKALVLLVVACPCALVISTPVTVVSALASAARRGILIKGGVYLEDARKLKAIALDKTGTVTEGKPQLVETTVIAQSFNEAEMKVFAASLASRSDHPVSKAIASGLNLPAVDVSEFKALVGRGVQGRIGQQTFVLGNHRLIEERGQCSRELEEKLKAHETQGRTVTLLASEAGVHGLFAVADTIKPSSQEAVAELKALGVKPVMLTGDNKLTAQNIAKQAGIETAHGDLLPTDKLTAIEDLRTWNGATAMVGDGINDAPALAKADIGIAMGGAGTDTAMEAADIIIMNDDLRRIPEVIRLSQRTHSVLLQNISLALGIKAIFLALAIFNQATMWMAVFADMGASLIVVANGLRLLRK